MVSHAAPTVIRIEDVSRLLVDQVRDYAMYVLDPSGLVLTWNAGAQRLKGYTASEIIGQHFSVFYLKSDVAAGKPEHGLEVARRRGRFEDEGWRVRKDGSRIWADVVITALHNEQHELVGFAKVTRDLTQRRRDEDALLEGEQRFRLLVQGVRDYAIFMLDPNGLVATWNDGAELIKGYWAEEIIGKHLSVFYPPEDVAAGKPERELEAAVRLGRVEDEGWRVRKDGSRFWASVVITALRNSSGELTGFAKVTRDLTERRARMEEALADARRVATETSGRVSAEARASELATLNEALQDQATQLEEQAVQLEEQATELEEQTATLQDQAEELEKANHTLRGLIDGSPLAIAAVDPGGKVLSWNAAAERMFGWTAEEVLTRFLPNVPEDKEEESAAFRRRLLAGQGFSDLVTTRQRKDGKRIEVSVSTAPLRDISDAAVGVIFMYSEVTERRYLEEQLRQAQKMEAVGQLAGGVAHDFNNILAVIMSYGDLMLGELGANTPMSADLREVTAAAARAAGLTRQLLAFSRRQVLQPHVVQLNALITNLEKMLRRLLRESIELTTTLDPALGYVYADAGQIEQVLVNLVVNARDAIPHAGDIAIVTSNVQLDAEYGRLHSGASAGAYVMVSISDTGCGMTPEVQERIFEPFFTTKERDRGTGLGLSTAYGIVKQSGGYVWCYSEPGKGTTFKIYLPRVESADDPMPMEAPAPASRGSETILLVEDEAAVRLVASRILRQGGYTVIEAPDGAAAVALCMAHEGPMDLVVTDMVMPGMTAHELAAQVRAIRPQARVLFMSGYTEDAAVRQRVLEPGAAFLEKPFTVQTLIRAVQGALSKA
jgi:two-component system, cell cycle sensor histidine kinase and response regulator CckA